MNISTRISVILAISVMAAQPVIASDSQTVEPPEDAVIIGGGDKYDEAHQRLFEALYEPSDWHYEVQQAPRFLFVDRKGRIALGIGGNLKGTLQYDFDGSIDANGSFIPQEIPVPQGNAQRTAFDGTVNNSLLYLRLVGHQSKLGTYGAYIETQFSGGADGNSLYLKQAWANIGYLRAGKATALFNDDDAAPFTVDEQGPAGGSCTENVAIQFTPRFGKDDRFTAGIAVEVPQLSSTFHADAAGVDEAGSIRQRIPDIPAYIQYAWDDRDSRVRLSGIVRGLAYRDNLTQADKTVTGWGVSLSGNIASIPNTTIFYQCIYGKGIGQYINDLSGYGYDLIASATTPGRMTAPGSLGYFAGVQYDFSDKFFMSATYSQARLYDQQSLGDDAYRYGQYIAANAVCTPVTGLQFGLEYLWGKRTDADHTSNHANRIMVMASYSF